MSTISDRLKEIRENLPIEVTLVAVSKTKPVEDLQTAYDAGQRDFGENKVQEMLMKHEVLPKDIRWHMIGHLQRNKVASLIGKTHLIHGIDSLRLLKEIDKRGREKDVIVDGLLQVHIATEDSKFGFDEKEIESLIKEDINSTFPNVRIKGLMGMATFTDDQEQVQKEFDTLSNLFQRIKNTYTSDNFDTLSMGMSGDYKLAINSGSTMVRVGSLIFGNR